MYFFSSWYPSLLKHLPNFLETIDSSRGKSGWQSHLLPCGTKYRSLYHSYQTKDTNQCVVESHRKTIDLQYCYSGSEKISFGNLLTSKEHISYDKVKDKDIWSADIASMQYLTLESNSFVLFEPYQLHCPQQKEASSDMIEKIVLKIPSSIIGI